MKVENLLQNEEGKTLEFKENASSLDKILKTVIAFSNTSGGKIVIGVADKTRHIVGVKDPHKLEESIANTISDSIHPQIVPNIEILSYQEKNLLLIEVFPGSYKPYFLKTKGEQSSAYVRVGSTNRQADTFMLESLRRSSSAHTYDEKIVYEASCEEIDFRLASESFEPFKKLTKNHLISLGVMEKENVTAYPTVGGLLLFSHNKERYFPDAWIQAGRFDGTEKLHILDSQKITVPFVKAADEIMGFIRKHLNVALKITGVQHTEVWSIPQIALREAVINSILHADYSLGGSPIRVAIFDDRIEIENPGILPFGLSMEQIEEGISKIRNRVIARVFHELKMIERWGSGIKRMIESCREAGLKEPFFEEVGYHFRVTLYNRRLYAPVLSSSEEKILLALRSTSGLTTKEIAELVGLSVRQVRNKLISFIEKKLVYEIARNQNDPERKYFLV